ncbi:MAG: S66 peptidase family protein, partial [Chitinophagales bacterium]
MANTTRRNFTKSLIISALATSFPSTVLQSKQSKAIFQKKAKRLRPNDTVGIVAPCSKLAAGKLDEAIEKIKNLGLKVKLGNHVSKKNGYLAGTDAQRLDDVHRMFADPTVSAVWSVRGGYGSSRILPKLDYSLIRKNPKILIGYSDMTALLQAVYKKTGLVGFHGPMGTSTFNDYVVKHFKKIIMNPQPQLVINYAEANSNNEDPLFKTHAIRDGIAKGKLMGGNLTLLAALAGTPYDFNFRNKLVFLEDIGEKPYRIDRMLTQLMQSSNLDEASGIV